MKKESQIKSGFTLLETVISMMIISIISVGVYNSYLILIRNTKDGEVKQKAALIGKQVVEQIRNGEIDSDSGAINYDKDGKVTSDNSVYIAKITKEKQNISISGGKKQNVYYISGDKITDEEKEVKTNDKYSVEKTILIKLNKSSDISIENNKERIGEIDFEGSSNENPIYDKYSVSLNLKYLTQDSKITVHVNNESYKEINLYIVTGDEKPEIEVINSEGSVNTAYRSDDYNTDGRNGELYKITVIVGGKYSNGEFKENLFSANVLKNIS